MTFETLAARMRALVDDGRRAGIAWGVLHKGRVAALDAHGLRDIAAGLPMEPDTVFRIYSQSRIVTAAAIMKLVEEGRLAMDDRVADYLPAIGEIPVIAEMARDRVIATEPQREPMRVRHLFGYTSGLGYAHDWPPSLGAMEADILTADGDLDTFVERLARLPLLSQPGARWSYGYHSDVLGAVAQKAAGQPLDAFLRERLFDPLGMADTGFCVQRGGADRLAKIYSPDGNGGLVPGHELPLGTFDRPGTQFSAGGGLVSTVSDFLRFGQMMVGGGTLDGARVLLPETVAAIGTDALRPEQGEIDFSQGFNPPMPYAGYGWGLAVAVRRADGPHVVPGSPGDMAWGGLADTAYFIDPARDLVAVAMAQYVTEFDPELVFSLRETVYADL